MRPTQLRPEHFNAYPPEARKLAISRLNVLQSLPLSLAPLLLRELIVYDWKFPAERDELDHQFDYLSAQSREQLQRLIAPFERLNVSAELESVDWVNAPAQFSQQLSAYLWATHQIDFFRKASVDYVAEVNASAPQKSLPLPRLSLVLIGQKASDTDRKLFRYLRPHGVHFSNVIAAGGRATLFDLLTKRAAEHPIPFGHWYIEGGDLELSQPGLTCISYNALRPVCDVLLNRMIRTMQPGGGGPEKLRTELAQTKPEDLGVPALNGNAVLSHFKLTLLTEGSGTQIFSTTFVQWAARESLRRAQPVTLLARFNPRQRDAEIRGPVAGAKSVPVDPDASLIDADMGAYYTWINQQRLSGSDQSRFLVWFEAHNQAFAVGPPFKAGTTDATSVTLKDITARMA